MKKTKKLLLILSSLVVVSVTVLVIILSNKPMSYSSAKSRCTYILNTHQDDMESISLKLLEGAYDETTSVKYNDYPCFLYLEDEFVKFEIDGQGFLGGQYWELRYCKNGTLYGEEKTYTNKDGNDIIRAEKITDNWWFYWIDYDGTELSSK